MRTTRARAGGTPDLGRGEGAGTEEVRIRRVLNRCRRCAGIALCAALLVAACGDGAPSKHLEPRDGTTPLSPLPRASEAVEPAGGVGSWARQYTEAAALLRLGSDVEAAQASLIAIVDGASLADATTAARAALRIAELEAQAGHRRRAAEYLARARSLGRGRSDLLERADDLDNELSALPGSRSEVRGPPIGSALENAATAAAAAFSEAERLLAQYHERSLAPRLEALRAAIRLKDAALESAGRGYRAAIAHGDPLVSTAAEFRIGSLHHDMALALSFDLPPELDVAAAARTRKSLRSRALSELRKAEAAYRRCLAGSESAVAFTHAAGRELRAVEDLLSALE